MQIGPYRILRELGRGGQGIVYLGRDDRGELAAVKVVPHVDRAFERELAAARQVDEFCTARVLFADLDHDPPYVAGEYIDGPPLTRAAPLRGPALTRLAIGTATALTAIHRAGVVHRDFKPANVLMGPDGPRVIDFGIARLVDISQTQGTSGTPPYMAPEQFTGGETGPAADVFAWGATMVFAATGRPPFGMDTFAAIAYRILHAPPDLGDLPEPLRGTVTRCLAKDPATRPTARDLLLELLGEPATAPPGRGGAPGGQPPDAAWQEAALRQGTAAAHPAAPGSGPAPPGSGPAAHQATPGGAPPPPGGAPTAPTAMPGGTPFSRRPSAVTGPPGSPVTTAPGSGGGAVPRKGVSRRALLAAGGAVAAAAVTAGVVLWRGGQGTGEKPVGDGPTPGTQGTTPQGTTPQAGTGTPLSGPPAPGQLADAVQTAVALAPLADFTFDGRLAQGTWHTVADGRVSYAAQTSESRADMRVTAEHPVPKLSARVVTLDGEDFVNGKPVTDYQATPIMIYADMAHEMASIRNLIGLARATGQLKSAGRTYTGSLTTTDAPERLWRVFENGETTREQLEKTTLSWTLKLDQRDRPRSLDLAWNVRLPGGGDLLSHTYEIRYAKWRVEEIARPG
ncbi:serine/threonine-protein kinase [Nonomuraea typhae]|uniref:serine/threonine-protein kinase n=1 Tax=Nonomuraea typhae TaxID=2603600 RepID=UPI0012F9AC66|nr:serine/threonine-protein kinase [Nonomuraea typhae]